MCQILITGKDIEFLGVQQVQIVTLFIQTQEIIPNGSWGGKQIQILVLFFQDTLLLGEKPEVLELGHRISFLPVFGKIIQRLLQSQSLRLIVFQIIRKNLIWIALQSFKIPDHADCIAENLNFFKHMPNIINESGNNHVPDPNPFQPFCPKSAGYPAFLRRPGYPPAYSKEGCPRNPL